MNSPVANDSAPRVDSAVAAISGHIRHNALAPGDRLPSEAFFSRELSVSRTVVREAFRSLAAMHLVEISAGKRAVVARLDHAALSPMIEHGVNTEQISVRQIYDVRRTVESRTVALAALRGSDAGRARIVDLARRMQAPGIAPPEIMELDIAFHIEIARESHNPIYTLIVGAFESVNRQTWPINWRSRTTQEEQDKMLQLHLDLALAVQDGDPVKSTQLMARHFDDSLRVLDIAGIA